MVERRTHFKKVAFSSPSRSSRKMIECRTHFTMVAGSSPSRSSRKMVECMIHFSPWSSTDALSLELY